VRMKSPPELPFGVDPSRLFVVDVDGDGCADVVLVDNGTVRWWPNQTGTAFGAVREVRHVPTGAMQTIRIADVLGNGTPALCWSMTIAARTAWYALDLLGGTRPAVLTEIDNGIGLTTAISYTTSALEAERDRADGNAWPSRLPLVLPVVSETVATDVVGPGSTTTTRYRYHDGRFDTELREFCGFARVEEHDIGDDHTPGLATVRIFNVGLRSDGSEPPTLAERRRARAIRGRLLSVERSDEDGNVFDRIEYEWELADTDNPAVVRPRQRGMTTSVLEGGAAPVSWITTENLAWDADGNLTQAEERSYEAETGPDTPTAILRTNAEFAVDPNRRYRQRVARVVQTDATGDVVADTRTAYDGAPPGSVGAHGLVTARSALAIPDALVADVYAADEPDFAALGYRRGDGGWWIDLARYERTDDAGGLRGTVTGPRGSTTEIVFDPSRSFPASVVDAGGNATTAVNDVRLCRVTSFTDASGETTTAAYDPLARVTALVRPGDTAADPGVAYAYATDVLPVRVTTSERTGDGIEPTVAHDLYDGTGRLLQRQVVDDSGVVADASTVYGSRGLPVRVWAPCRLAGAAGAYASPPAGAANNELYHDALGRPVAVVRPDGARRTVRRLPGVIEEADEEDLRSDAAATHAGTVTRQILDAAGRARAVEQRVGVRVLRSTYAFDVKGRLRTQTDASGATTAFTHDLLGRLLRVQRPEATTIAVLDASGNLAETRNGSARVFRAFDALDRPVEVRHDEPHAIPVVRCTYHDATGAAPADAGTHTGGGRLVRVDHAGGSYVYDYDEAGRITRKTMSHGNSAPLTLDLAYRPDGLLDRVTYPGTTNRPSVAYHYDRRGRLTSIDGIVSQITYDETGRRLQTHYANGVVQHNAFDEATGWLSSLHLAGPGATVFRDLAYRHDLTGNLVAIDSPDAAHAWTYAYDDLYRLTEARNGADVLTYAYDDGGNILDTSRLGAYRYGEAGAAETLLTSIAGAGAPDAFAWDDRGHLHTAPWGTHTVDAEGRLRRIDLAAGGREAYDYDHTGALVRRVTTSAHGGSVVRFTPDPLVEQRAGHLVFGVTDGSRIVARLYANGKRNWLHADHLGSLILVTDDTGAAVANIRYGPYGEITARTGSVSDELGFGTGRAAAPNLVLLGERWYCPELGRFLSPDPVAAAVYDPMSWNAYAYCLCNPTSIVDPTGRDFWKIFAAVVATIAIIAVVVIVSVFTFGIASPGAVAIGAAGISVTWGAVFAATIAAVVIGGVVGGIAAARAGGDAGDIVLGALVGAAVGGWAAFGAAFAGPAVAGVFGLHAGIAAGAVAGAVSGAINGAAMGFAAGFAGGRNNGLGDIMTKVLVGALIGAAIGAALGAASGITPPKNPDGTATTPGQALQRSWTPDPPSQSPAGLATPPAAAAAPSSAPTLLGAGGQLAARVLVPQAEIFASGITGFTGSIITQTIAVDLLAGTGSLLFTDLQQYLNTHRVDLGPFNFFKGSW
jgi:RHS repeat-associated protein